MPMACGSTGPAKTSPSPDATCATRTARSRWAAKLPGGFDAWWPVTSPARGPRWACASRAAGIAAVGVLGGVLRDLAPAPDEIWRFTPFFDLNVYRFFKESRNHQRTAFHLEFTAGILVAEFLRQLLDGWRVFSMNPPGSHLPAL